MSEMDKDGDGTISYEEFESWWRNNGGDLEKHRELAFTVVLPDINLLLVRPSNFQRVLSVSLSLCLPVCHSACLCVTHTCARTRECNCVLLSSRHLKICMRWRPATQVAENAAVKKRWLLGLQAMLRKLGKAA